jgi:hypothetical protein
MDPGSTGMHGMHREPPQREGAGRAGQPTGGQAKSEMVDSEELFFKRGFDFLGPG